ncbi:MAG: ABC transporter substrate-binding protein [Candidatus Rokubacteria bacterium]|nr:ABC transporter substrate-binding protein [Candidatus Rokubacteria bacterium]
MAEEVSRREFMNRLGVVVGTAGATMGSLVAPAPAHAQPKAKGTIPDKPFKTGHMTFFTGPAAVLGEQSYMGHVMAADEINAQGGLLGKRKIETVKADEAAGTDANVKELRRMKLSEGIDLFTGVISSGNTPALGPVAEELKLLTLFTDGCTDFLFEKAVPNPHYVFRLTNIQSADGVMAAIAASTAWPGVKKIAHIHPDYSYGRNAFDHFNVAMKKLSGNIEVVSEAWPKLGTTDFTAHITKTISAKPDLLFTSVWGGDYVALYKQSLRYDLYKKMKAATTLAFGAAPHSLGKDHPEGLVAGVHANYHFLFPPGNKWPLNAQFVKKFHDRWKEYPNFEAEGAYSALHVLRVAVEKANQLVGGWPDENAIIAMLEGLMWASPAGYVYIRPDNHQGYKDALTGFSMNTPDYPFPVPDPKRVITVPIRSITAPPGWPKGEPTSTFTWIEQTWPKVS